MVCDIAHKSVFVQKGVVGLGDGSCCSSISCAMRSLKPSSIASSSDPSVVSCSPPPASPCSLLVGELLADCAAINTNSRV